MLGKMLRLLKITIKYLNSNIIILKIEFNFPQEVNAVLCHDIKIGIPWRLKTISNMFCRKNVKVSNICKTLIT